MPYRVGLFIKTEKGNKVVNWLDDVYKTQLEAALVVVPKNKEKGINLSSLKIGDEFYIYRSVVFEEEVDFNELTIDLSEAYYAGKKDEAKSLLKTLQGLIKRME